MGFFWLVFHCTFPCLPEKVCPGVLHFHRWMFAVWAFPMSTTARSGHAGCGIWPDLRAASPWSWWQVRRENHGSWGPIHRSLWFCVPRFIEVPRFIKVDSFPVQMLLKLKFAKRDHLETQILDLERRNRQWHLAVVRLCKTILWRQIDFWCSWRWNRSAAR